MKALRPIGMLFTAVALVLFGYFQGYKNAAQSVSRGDIETEVEELRDALAHQNPHHGYEHLGVIGFLNATVREKPFGMRIKLGSTVVENVFPGFPAHELGVRPGCQVREIGGKLISQGNYLQTMQETPVPFNMSLYCPPALPFAAKTDIPLSSHDLRVIVNFKTFGMDVQVPESESLPRVMNVLPGYPAEAAGVKAGYILKAVNDLPVGAHNWFRLWQMAEVPCSLTFDTAAETPVRARESTTSMPKQKKKPSRGAELSATVNARPFGMHIALKNDKPTVHTILKGFPAEKAGIKVGDVLLSVAGANVNSESWFSAFEQSVPPFGLRLIREVGGFNMTQLRNMGIMSPNQPLKLEDLKQKQKQASLANFMNVTVKKRPFGMSIQKGTLIVQDVFPDFPASKAGVRKGCVLKSMNGVAASAGKWMQNFENLALPFNISLFCPTNSYNTYKALTALGKNAKLPQNKNSVQVIVTKRPFGMNVQAKAEEEPRVLEVIAGSLAEKVGVKPGFVLMTINGKVVNGSSWSTIWQTCKLPCPLTFDSTSATATTRTTKQDSWKHASIDDSGKDAAQAKSNNGIGGKTRWRTDEEHKAVKDALKEVKHSAMYRTVRIQVTKQPFGMHVATSDTQLPIVQSVVPNGAAFKAGVQEGDTLVEVAGVKVDSSSWFRLWEQATVPFGVKFRRHISKDARAAGMANSKLDHFKARDQYRTGWNGSSACPNGYVHITAASVCEKAVKKLNIPWTPDCDGGPKHLGKTSRVGCFYDGNTSAGCGHFNVDNLNVHVPVKIPITEKYICIVQASSFYVRSSTSIKPSNSNHSHIMSGFVASASARLRNGSVAFRSTRATTTMLPHLRSDSVASKADSTSTPLLNLRGSDPQNGSVASKADPTNTTLSSSRSSGAQ